VLFVQAPSQPRSPQTVMLLPIPIPIPVHWQCCNGLVVGGGLVNFLPVLALNCDTLMSTSCIVG
jgi:hypothetical protein